MLIIICMYYWQHFFQECTRCQLFWKKKKKRRNHSYKIRLDCPLLELKVKTLWVWYNIPVIMSWNRINISIHVQLEIFVSPGLLPLFLIAKQLLKTNFPVSQLSTLMLLKYPCLTSWRRSLGTSCWNSDSTHCNKLSPTTAKAFLHKVFLYRIHSWVLEPDYFS